VEVVGGVFRAARRWPEAELDQLWGALGPVIADELASVQQESILDWQYTVRLIISGTSRRLRLPKDRPSEEASIRRLATFVLSPAGGGKGRLWLEPLPGADTAEWEVDEGSSNAHATKVKILQALFVGLRRTTPAVSDALRAEILGAAAPALQVGLEHPYNQIHQESAKAIAIGMNMGMTCDTTGIKTWVQQRAIALSTLIVPEPERSPLVIEAKSLVLCLLHGILGRDLEALVLRCLPLFAASVSHADHELRALGSNALRTLAHAVQRGPSQELAGVVIQGCVVPSEVDMASRTRWLEEMAKFVGSVALKHYFSMHGTQSGEGERLCRELLISLLKEDRIEVRTAAQEALAPLNILLSSKQVSALAKKWSKLNGDQADEAVHGLASLLLAAGSLASPDWLGGVIEGLSKVGTRPEGKKEVERVVQAFLKQQQVSREVWRRCQSRLSSEQMELLKAGQGTLSYFS